MTTPADWRALIPRLKERESIELVKRLVQFQREWLDTQAAQLEEVSKLLDEQAQNLDKG